MKIRMTLEFNDLERRVIGDGKPDGRLELIDFVHRAVANQFSVISDEECRQLDLEGEPELSFEIVTNRTTIVPPKKETV
ncbi:MAG: hypothetical protein ACK4S4_16020 [Pyrinomonadaceae bacterium]